ncbi:MAG: hypothetical protein D3925_03520 [Candidatus Electrothrix sp. AR5]|nr:hypothetical protein [Candidatus Electrothrix sp. AR5]
MWTRNFLILLAIALSGCSPSNSVFQVPGDGVNNETYTLVKDASIAKETLVHQTKQIQFKEYGKAHAKAGLEIEFALVPVAEGVTAYLPKKISFKEQPNFASLGLPPTEPSKHPIWNTVDNIANKGLWAFLGWNVLDWAKGYGAGHTYNGPVDMRNSYNTAGDAQTFSGSELYQGDVNNGSESEEWYKEISGCSSKESYSACMCSTKPDYCKK